jgi:hypothetical protein
MTDDDKYQLVEEIQLPEDVKLHIMASDDEVLMVFEGAAVVAILGNTQNEPGTNTLLTLNVAKSDSRTTARPYRASQN